MSDETKPKMMLVDPNDPQAKLIADTIVTSMKELVPMNLLFGASIRIFAVMILAALDAAKGDVIEHTRVSLLTLLGQLTEAVRTYPELPAKLLVDPREKKKVH